MNWVAKLTREFTTLFHRLSIDPASEQRQPAPIRISLYHQLQFLLRFRRSRVIMHQTTNRSNLPYTVALTFNLGSGTRDTLRTRCRAHAKHLFSIRFTRSQLSHLFPLSLSLVYLPATSSQLPHSPRRVASKNLTLRRVSLSPFPLLCCRNAWSSVLREAQARPRSAAFTFTTFVSFVSSSHRYHAIPTTSDLVFPA